MNKIIKIALLSLVIIGIVSVIIYFINGPGDPPKKQTIASTPFEKEIDSKIKAEIEGKDYETASKAFYQILEEIETEASIVNSDGSKQLSENEVKNCKENAFVSYEPIFERYQSEYFNRSSWSESELSALKSRAQELLSMDIAQDEAKRTIQKVINNVNDYHSAWSVVKSARSCSSVSAINALKSKVANYNHAPLTNNASLRAGLNSAYNDAKNALAGNIKAYCTKVAQGYKSYGNYERFYAAEESALSRISEYERAFGSGSFGQVKSMLNQADQNAMDYYDD